MPTGIKLHPLAQARLGELEAALQKDFGVEASQRTIASAAVYGVTAAQLAGILSEFTRAKAAHAAGQSAVEDDDGGTAD